MPNDRRRLAKSFYSAGGIGLVLLIILLTNLIASRADVRWDATEDHLYSLSKGTLKILDGLENHVTLKVFYSSSVVNMPSHIKTFASRALDFLSEYEYYSAGKVKIEQYDPVMDSEEEEWAQKYGLEGVNLPSGEKVYFGLVAVHADQEEAMAFIDPSREPHLEYDITRIISRVSHPKKEKIAVISSLPVFGTPPMGFTMPGQPPSSPPWLFIQELQKSYTVEPLGPAADKIDADIDLLILFHPKNLSHKLLYAIDQHVLSGGNLIAFADPVSVMDDPRSGGIASDLKPLFTSWGVSMDTGKVVADYSFATRLRNQNNQPELNPLWISTRPQAFNSQDIITAKLESTLLPVAGALVKEPESSYDFAPLIQSSPNSGLVDAFKSSLDAEALGRDFKPSNQKYNLAVKISGVFKSAFPEGPLPETPKTGEETLKDVSQNAPASSSAGLKQGTQKSTIVIIADSDLLYDGYYVSKQNFLGYTISNVFNDNLNLLLNSAEVLTGSDALIEIRSRGSFDRPFTRVAALEEKAQVRWRDREQELVQKVEQTNDTLRQLEQQKDASQRAIISPEQQAEIEKFQDEKRRINNELKIVRRNLRADIESLGRTVKFINIFLMPLLVSLAGILYAVYLARRRSAA
jgi:ABC-type uncharacterized transport system involved in gliding motility auxiliary subunit